MSAQLEMPEWGQRVPPAPPIPSVPRDVALRMLAKGPAEMVSMVVTQLNAAAFRLATCKTKQEFEELRKEVFQKYAKLSVALSNIVSAEGRDTASLSELVSQSLKEFESTLRDLLPEECVEEATFSLSTLRRTYKMLTRIVSTPPPIQSVPEDRETAAEYNYWILWSQLHLDCLLMALRGGVKISGEVIHEILAGLRCVVMAYSCARQGIRLREFPRQFDFSGVVWDREDSQLAMESTSEREATLPGW